jgi:para-nitrobenzyl esterase
MSGPDGGRLPRRAVIAAALASPLLLGGRRARTAQPGPVVDTAFGKVRGLQDGSLHRFRGLRYGASTQGRRFLPPRAPEPWTGLCEAVQFGNRCPQAELKVMPESRASETHEPMGEDCLFLNVWTTGLTGSGKRPVMVWLHGGGFANGSGANIRYDGSNLALRHDVVAVTLNHRLNAFGHLHLGDLLGAPYAASGDVGMQDIVLALHWVRDNIEAFGGDPGRVTILGESGGGRKVSVLMAMPSAKGLFHRAIVQSGATLRMSTPDEAARQTLAVLGRLGLGRSDAAKLAHMPIHALAQAAPTDAMGELRPVVDGAVLPRHPFDPTAPDISTDVPMIIGHNATETTFRADTPLDPISDDELQQRVRRFTGATQAEAAQLIAVYRKSRPQASAVALYQLISTDYWIGADTALQAQRKGALGGAPAYVYRFEKTTPVRQGKLRSPHMLDVPYVLDNLDKAREFTGTEAGDDALASVLSRSWTAFARAGDPNGAGLPHWPAFDGEGRAVMVINDVSQVALDPHREERLAIAALKARQA